MEYKAADITPPTKEKMLQLVSIAENSGIDARIR
jgi:hypothetical protein